MTLRRSLAVAAAGLLLAGWTDSALAARSRNKSTARGGSATRAASGGEALAQTFYTRAVDLGRQRQYGQAASLMKRAVDKNGSNEKYRYYLALLLYKIGDYGEASDQCRRLQRGKLERYRQKSKALMGRIDMVLKGELEAGPAAAPAPGSTLQVLPDGAYTNVAAAAREVRSGKAEKVQPVRGAVMTPEQYSSWRQSQTAAGVIDKTASGRSLASDVAAAAAKTTRQAEGKGKPAGTGKSGRAPEPAEEPAVVASTAAGVDAAEDWADAASEPAAKPASKPAEKPATKPAKDDDFAAVFDDGEAAPESPFSGAPAAAPAKPATKPSEKPAAQPAPAETAAKPAEKPAAKPAAPAAKPADDEFSVEAFESDEPAAAGKPAEKPAAKPAAKPATKPAEKPAAKPGDDFSEDVFEEF